MSQLRPNYEAALSEYNRILDHKHYILKERYENPALLEILPEFNARLCQVGALLISYRARFFEGLGREAKVYHETFSGGREEFRLQYHTVSTVTDPFAPVSQLHRQRAMYQLHALCCKLPHEQPSPAGDFPGDDHEDAQ